MGNLGAPFLRPMVGRSYDLLWVVDATYRRSSRRPTVGFFLPPLKGAGNKGFGRELDRFIQGEERIDEEDAPSTSDLLQRQGIVLLDEPFLQEVASLCPPKERSCGGEEPFAELYKHIGVGGIGDRPIRANEEGLFIPRHRRLHLVEEASIRPFEAVVKVRGEHDWAQCSQYSSLVGDETDGADPVEVVAEGEAVGSLGGEVLV